MPLPDLFVPSASLPAGHMPPPQSLAAVHLFSALPSQTSPATPTPSAASPSLPEIEANPNQLSQSHTTAPPLRLQQALLLFFALPPIPAQVVGRIKLGPFVEMRELLPDNVALLQRLQETSIPGHPQPANPSCLRDIHDPVLWAACFKAFLAAKTEFPGTQELMAYGKILISWHRSMEAWDGPCMTQYSGSK